MLLSNGNHDGNQWEPDMTTLSLVRGMVLEQRSQNEIIERAFPGIRKADAVERFRTYLAEIVK